MGPGTRKPGPMVAFLGGHSRRGSMLRGNSTASAVADPQLKSGRRFCRCPHGPQLLLILACFATLFLVCYAPVLFGDRQFGYRDAAQYYYPLYQRVQEEWNAGRWPLWEPEENAGMPLLGNPTAAVLYPGKLIFAMMPYAWGARVYTVTHTALAFVSMLVLMRSWQMSWVGSALSALSYAFGIADPVPV